MSFTKVLLIFLFAFFGLTQVESGKFWNIKKYQYLLKKNLIGFPKGYPQDWDYVEVRKGAHIFWWLHETLADTNATNRPLVLWLQGGPGASGTGVGNFQEIGPVDLNLKKRNFTWINHANVLFVDSPVEAGFSYIDSDELSVETNEQMVEDLVEFLKGFYKKRPEFESVPLHIFGQSYGGNMAVRLAYALNKEIEAGKIKCNLKSIALGNPSIDRVASVNSYAPLLFQTVSMNR
jgi:serine carboxypeptidase 1